MKKRRFITALALFNGAIFLLTTAFLPGVGSFSYSGPIDRYIKARADWDIAFVVLFASLLVSLGVYLIVDLRDLDPNEGKESDH